MILKKLYGQDVKIKKSQIVDLDVKIITNQVVATNEFIDGKQVYVKRISKQLGDNTTVSVLTGLSNVTIIKYNGIQTNGIEYACVPYSDPTGNNIYVTVCWMPSIGQMNFMTYTNRTSYTAYMNIYFTYN